MFFHCHLASVFFVAISISLFYCSYFHISSFPIYQNEHRRRGFIQIEKHLAYCRIYFTMYRRMTIAMPMRMARRMLHGRQIYFDYKQNVWYVVLRTYVKSTVNLCCMHNIHLSTAKHLSIHSVSVTLCVFECVWGKHGKKVEREIFIKLYFVHFSFDLTIRKH